MAIPLRWLLKTKLLVLQWYKLNKKFIWCRLLVSFMQCHLLGSKFYLFHVFRKPAFVVRKLLFWCKVFWRHAFSLSIIADCPRISARAGSFPVTKLRLPFLSLIPRACRKVIYLVSKKFSVDQCTCYKCFRLNMNCLNHIFATKTTKIGHPHRC